jgi:hypothetical protein
MVYILSIKSFSDKSLKLLIFLTESINIRYLFNVLLCYCQVESDPLSI